jgi:hypothetical protein
MADGLDKFGLSGRHYCPVVRLVGASSTSVAPCRCGNLGSGLGLGRSHARRDQRRTAPPAKFFREGRCLAGNCRSHFARAGSGSQPAKSSIRHASRRYHSTGRAAGDAGDSVLHGAGFGQVLLRLRVGCSDTGFSTAVACQHGTVDGTHSYHAPSGTNSRARNPAETEHRFDPRT